MAFLFLIALSWFGVIWAIVHLLKIGNRALIVVLFTIVMLIHMLAMSGKKERLPSYPRPEGDTMEDRFRQREWDEIKRGLNP